MLSLSKLMPFLCSWYENAVVLFSLRNTSEIKLRDFSGEAQRCSLTYDTDYDLYIKGIAPLPLTELNYCV